MVSHTEMPAIRTVNPGDRIAKLPQTMDEKSKQLAVDAPDITGDHIVVPAYFIVEYPDGEQKALHHVRDAKAISDLVRQYQFDQDSADQELVGASHVNLSVPALILALFVITIPFLIGIF